MALSAGQKMFVSASSCPRLPSLAVLKLGQVSMLLLLPTRQSIWEMTSAGVIIPYFAFVSLMDDSNFHNYLKKVLEKFEETEGSLTQLFLTGELNDVDENIINEDENEEADVGAKKKRKKAVTLAVEDDDNDNDTDTADMGKRNRPSTPMAGVDFSEEEPLVSPAATAGSANKKTTTRKGITKK